MASPISALLTACQTNTVGEFIAAAKVRYEDGLALMTGPVAQHTAAVYLWGYAVEMALKAATFRTIGYSDGMPIEVPDDLGAVKQLAKLAGVQWPKTASYHALDQWARFLVRFRVKYTGAGYTDKRLGGQIIARADRVHRVWRETLRYHVAVPNSDELAEVRRQAEWFVQRVDVL